MRHFHHFLFFGRQLYSTSKLAHKKKKKQTMMWISILYVMENAFILTDKLGTCIKNTIAKKKVKSSPRVKTRISFWEWKKFSCYLLLFLLLFDILMNKYKEKKGDVQNVLINEAGMFHGFVCVYKRVPVIGNES